MTEKQITRKTSASTEKQATKKTSASTEKQHTRKTSESTAKPPKSLAEAAMPDSPRPARSTKAAAAAAAPRATQAPAPAGDTASREHMVAVAAYFRAQARGFEPGHELEDWLAAEAHLTREPEAANAA